MLEEPRDAVLLGNVTDDGDKLVLAVTGAGGFEREPLGLVEFGLAPAGEGDGEASLEKSNGGGAADACRGRGGRQREAERKGWE